MRVKSINKKETLFVRSKRETVVSVSTNNEKVVFSFENFSANLHGLDCSAEEFKQLVKHLKILSSTTWQTVQNSPRHGLGSEIINVNELSENLPVCYNNKKEVLAFRYGGRKAFVGIRNEQVLDILFIDPTFDLYNHE